jgi:hypothetical protein
MPRFGYESSARRASELPPPPPSLCVPQRPTPEPPDASRLLSLVADALTACESAGITVKLKHGAVWTEHGYVFKVGEKLWEPRTLAYTEFSVQASGEDED